RATTPHGAAFSTPYDSRGDRGSADFDQRHTFVCYSYWEIPRFGTPYVGRALHGFRFSQVAAIRSGFPYSIFTRVTKLDTIYAYARWADPKRTFLNPATDTTGGKQIFTEADFCRNDSCANPSTGRNQFAGPGLVNLDVSASRSFALPWLGESGSLTVRADAF